MGYGLGLNLGLGRGSLFTSFNPLTLSPTLWLDASDASTLFTDSGGTTPATSNGDNIGYFGDKSGGGVHFTQAGASKPTLSISGNVRSINFTGGQNLDSATATLITSGNRDFTIFAVYQPNLGAASYGALFGNYTAGKCQIYLGNGSTAYLTPFGIYLNANVDLSSDSYSTGVKLITIQRSSGNITGWQGSTQKSTVANTNSVYTGAGTTSVWSLGANTINTEGLEGKVHELLVVDSAVAATPLATCQSYLISKWGAS